MLFTALLIVWAIVIEAPLEEPAAPGAHAQPLQGALVLPRAAGAAGLLRPVDRGRAAARLHHRRADARSRTSTPTPRATATTPSRSGRSRSAFFWVGFLLFWVSLVDPGHVPARPELVVLRPVRVLGPAQARAAGQRRPLDHVLGQPARPAAARQSAGCARRRASSACSATSCCCRRSSARRCSAAWSRSMGAMRFNMFMHLFLWFALVPIKMVPALDGEPEVLHRHPRVLLQRLTCPAIRWPIAATPTTASRSLNQWFLSRASCCSSHRVDGARRLEPSLEGAPARVPQHRGRRDAAERAGPDELRGAGDRGRAEGRELDAGRAPPSRRARPSSTRPSEELRGCKARRRRARSGGQEGQVRVQLGRATRSRNTRPARRPEPAAPERDRRALELCVNRDRRAKEEAEIAHDAGQERASPR